MFEALVVFTLLNLVDYITTYYALSRFRDMREVNPIANFVLEKLGFVGLYVYKQVATGLVVLLVYLFSNIDIETTLWLWNTVLGSVVAWNSVQILVAKWRSRVKS